MMGCKIARLKTWGAKSHNWQKIGVKSAIKPIIINWFAYVFLGEIIQTITK